MKIFETSLIKKLTDINRCLTGPANRCLTDINRYYISYFTYDDDHRALRPPHPDYGLRAPCSRRVHTAAVA